MAVAPPVFLDEVVNVLRAFKRSLEAAVAAEVSTRCFPLLVMRGGEGSGKTVYRQALMIALAVRVHCVLLLACTLFLFLLLSFVSCTFFLSLACSCSLMCTDAFVSHRLNVNCTGTMPLLRLRASSIGPAPAFQHQSLWKCLHLILLKLQPKTQMPVHAKSSC